MVNDTVINLSNQLFMFNQPLVIQYSGDERYSTWSQTSRTYPIQFLRWMLAYFEKNQYEKEYGKSAQTGAIDTLLHTLLHEAGHGYIEIKRSSVKKKMPLIR